jgi:polyisoprenoid-binding protein YceI
MPTTVTQQIPTATYALDPVHSGVTFAVKHMVSAFRGGFSGLEAQLSVAEDGTITLEGEVALETLEVREPNLIAHLVSPDFFDASRFPRIRFRSTSVELGEDGEVTVDGELTIKDATHHVRATGQLSYVEADITGAPRVGVDLTTVIDRTQYGITWNAPLPRGGQALANDVAITAELEFTGTPAQEA